MDLGVPVLARDIPGNAAVVQHEVTGLLYSSPQVHNDKLITSLNAFNALCTDVLLTRSRGCAPKSLPSPLLNAEGSKVLQQGPMECFGDLKKYITECVENISFEFQLKNNKTVIAKAPRYFVALCRDSRNVGKIDEILLLLHLLPDKY